MLPTVKVKNGDDYAIINKSDFNPDQHQPYDEESAKAVGQDMSEADSEVAKAEALRQYEANRGVPRATAGADYSRNASGTYSEPTPTNIQFPNKATTEFENNFGMHIGKAAPQMRETAGLPDMPGGVRPMEAKRAMERVDAITTPVVATTGRDAHMPENPDEVQQALQSEGEQQSADGSDQQAGLGVRKGPGGKFFVWDGKERISGAFGNEQEANQALDTERRARANDARPDVA
jgi:hypothetical protein